jgi:hypothetical protein
MGHLRQVNSLNGVYRDSVKASLDHLPMDLTTSKGTNEEKKSESWGNHRWIGVTVLNASWFSELAEAQG